MNTHFYLLVQIEIYNPNINGNLYLNLNLVELHKYEDILEDLDVEGWKLYLTKFVHAQHLRMSLILEKRQKVGNEHMGNKWSR